MASRQGASESATTRLNRFINSSYFQNLSSRYFMNSINSENASIVSEVSVIFGHVFGVF